jgi:photosystem II stability/assembly factor-like uncharacterized protein
MKRSITMLSVSIAVVGLSCGIPAIADVPDTATISAAKSPADHEAIAKAYDAEATSLEKMAAMHKNLGETYTTQAGGKAWQAAQAKHCNSVASNLTAAAKEERALGAEHHKMATAPGH